MKRIVFLFGILILATAIAGLTIKAQETAHRLREKAARAQAGIRSWAEAGRDLSAVLDLMQQVKPTLDASDPHKSEALLDRALTLLSEGATLAHKSPLPLYAINELESDPYVGPVPVLIGL